MRRLSQGDWGDTPKRIIKSHFGISLDYLFKIVMKYLTEYRLKKAIHYLDETDENINSVFEKIGFGII